MPLQEAVVTPSPGGMAEEVIVPPLEPEITALLDNEAAQTAAQSYEYTRQDGTVEHAANRDEAIKLCPVLGKLATKDPEAANLLLEIAAIGQAKMTEKAEGKPEPLEQTEPGAKSEKPNKSVEPSKTRPIEKAEILRARTIPAEEVIHPKDSQEIAVHEVSAIEGPAKTVSEPDKLDTSRPKRVVAPAEPERPIQHEKRFAVKQEQVEPKTVSAIDTVQPNASVSHDKERLEPEQEEAIRINEPSEIEPVTIEPSPSSSKLVEIVPDIEHIESPRWADEVGKEPLQIYEEFSQTLQLLIVSSNKQVTTEFEDKPATIDATELSTSEESEIEALPAIAVTVARCLVELDGEDKQATALVLSNIVTKLDVMTALVGDDEVEPEVIETVQAELDELVAVLFEQLSIEYTVEDIAGFVAVLLSSDFQPPPPAASDTGQVDLEHDGTREAKLHFWQFTGGLTDIEGKIQHLLGQLILHYMIAGKTKNQMLAC